MYKIKKKKVKVNKEWVFSYGLEHCKGTASKDHILLSRDLSNYNSVSALILYLEKRFMNDCTMS